MSAPIALATAAVARDVDEDLPPLLRAAREHHSDTAWVVSAEQVLDERWFGSKVLPEVRARLGDVALVAREPVAYDDPTDTGPYELIGRHGSMTSAEVYVPLLVAGR